jgi:hypothetical protein
VRERAGFNEDGHLAAAGFLPLPALAGVHWDVQGLELLLLLLLVQVQVPGAQSSLAAWMTQFRVRSPTTTLMRFALG